MQGAAPRLNDGIAYGLEWKDARWTGLMIRNLT